MPAAALTTTGHLSPTHKPPTKESYVMSTLILPQTAHCGQSSQTNDNRITWLQDKIRFYTSEVERLEKELKHNQALLRGHQIWLAEVQKKASEQ